MSEGGKDIKLKPREFSRLEKVLQSSENTPNRKRAGLQHNTHPAWSSTQLKHSVTSGGEIFLWACAYKFIL